MATQKIPGSIDAISHRIECDSDIKICPLSDLHIGDAHADMDLIKSLISDIKNDSHSYTFLIGDLMNSAIANSKSDSYNERLTPQQQLDTCYDLCYPIKDKILGVVPGNHEERISKSVGMDITKILTDRLGISERYNSASALIILQIGQQRGFKSRIKPVNYSFFINHGHGGGRKVASKMNGLSDLSMVIDADVIIQGHTHVAAMFRQSQYRISLQNFVATPHEQILVNLPSAIRYGGYGMRGGYQPGSNRYPKIILCHDEHKIDVLM